jgi:hypothetical protein
MTRTSVKMSALPLILSLAACSQGPTPAQSTKAQTPAPAPTLPAAPATVPALVPLQINCQGEDKAYLTIDVHDHYSLAVKSGSVLSTADGPAGGLRA